MKYLILFGIRIYWLLPKNLRQRCLYKESCSKYIYRISSEFGFFEGIKALKLRMKSCRPNYRLLDIDNHRVLICSNGETINEDEMADWLKKCNE